MNYALTTGPLRIVIIGGGYVAVWAYRSLAKRLSKQLSAGQVEIAVICPMTYHSFHGWTGEALTGIVDLPNKYSELRSLMPKARILHGTATAVDVERQLVTMEIGKEKYLEQISYSHLVFATGSRDHTEAIPGASRFGWPIKGMGDELALKNHLVELLEKADTISDVEVQKKLLSIVIAGAGFAGVELCAAVAEMFRVLRPRYPILRKQNPKIVLVHNGNEILPQLRPQYSKLADYATEQLLNYGVDIRFGTRVDSISSSGAHLSTGEEIHSDTVISTIGLALTKLPGTESLPRDNDQRYLCDERLRIRSWSNVWAGGDTARVIHPKTGVPCPANALWAIKHGEHIGDAIACSILGKPILSFSYPGLGQAASFGIGKGITELYGMQFTGWTGWLMRMGFFLYFMPSRSLAARIGFDWLTLPWSGRRIVSLEPSSRTPEASPFDLESLERELLRETVEN